MRRISSFIILWPAMSFVSAAHADTDLPSKFSNLGSIVNSRHNMTQQPIGAGSATMNPYRNDYGEVCVYCHTPHGASSAVQAPLWNRTATNASYTTYDELGTASLRSEGPATPGPNSLTCLSCHDGTVAIDSIINMPGSGGYNAAQATTVNTTFLNQWNNTAGPDASVHIGLKEGECLACHSSGAGIVGSGATAFDAFAIGTDLRNDHPVGVTRPDEAGFATPVPIGPMSVFDTNNNNHADANEPRLYLSGSAYKVECASCHDPHGVPSAGPGSPLIRSFLRKSNDGSALCSTCHST